MFGKLKDDNDIKPLTARKGDGVFGDEHGAEQDAQLGELHDRVEQVEQQIRSQFTSMAAYAQIAQEQIDLARAESKAETERTEQRLTQLIERERNDRLEAVSDAPAFVGLTDATDPFGIRLDCLDAEIAYLATALRECLELQKTLANAISQHFAAKVDTGEQRLPAPFVASSLSALPTPDDAPRELYLDGPIAGLSLTG